MSGTVSSLKSFHPGRVRLLGIDVPEKEPLLGEVADECIGLGVGEHPPNLMVENRGVAEVPADGMVQQFVVGDAAPEKQREACRELVRSHALLGRHVALGLDDVEKPGRREYTGDDALHALLERRAPFELTGEES